MMKYIVFLLILSIFSFGMIACQATVETGTLKLVANGEDFIRSGFVTKDGWFITFDNAFIHLANIKAFQTSPPYDATANEEMKIKEAVSIKGNYTIDLAKGDETAAPIVVATIEAPIGHYNAISWDVTNTDNGELAGYSMMLQGTASKGEKLIPFKLYFDSQYAYTAGEYIGDSRKGFVNQGEEGELELTFHFDHMFGDGELSPDDELNQVTIGFEPFAQLAVNGEELILTQTDLQKLSAADYKKLLELLPTLGHVGEGHARSVELSTK